VLLSVILFLKTHRYFSIIYIIYLQRSVREFAVAKIYLSSTYSDLVAERKAVYETLRRLRHDVIAMEDYVATDRRPLDTCLADVASCDLYIGLFAWRYGYIPATDNPEGRSITALEYDKAHTRGRSCLIFLLHEDAAWPRRWMDAVTGEQKRGALIDALRQELNREKLVSFFSTAEDLANLVGVAVSNWERQQGLATGREPGDVLRTRYLEQVSRLYGSVRVPLGPATCALPAIFQPLSLRKDPQAAEDLERERRRALPDEAPEETWNPGSFSTALRGHEPRQQQQITVVSVEEAVQLSPRQRLVILGGPGTGKTTTLKHLAGRQAEKALADAPSALPIFLSLPALARSGRPLYRYLSDIVENLEIDASFAEQLWQAIQQGQAFLCLDGLDEVDPRERAELIALLNRKAAEPGNTWVVGSRYMEYKGGQFREGQFTEWELQPLTPSRRLELVGRLLPELQRFLEPDQRRSLTVNTFLRSLEQHPQAAWGENPFLLSLAAAVSVQKGTLPTGRAALYREVVGASLSPREQDTVRDDILLRILGEFALWLHQRGGRTFSREDLTAFLLDGQRRSWGDTAELIRSIVHAGLIEIVASRTYGFSHLTFQEYLAAAELARKFASEDPMLREEGWQLAWSKRTYSRWTEVLRLMVGILLQGPGQRGSSQALRWLEQLAALHSTPEGDPGNLGLLLALTSAGELSSIAEWQIRRTLTLEETLLTRWIDELLHTREGTPRQQRLLECVGQFGYLHEPAVQGLFALLRGFVHSGQRKKRAVVCQVLPVLGRLGAAAFLPFLQSKDAMVRAATVQALGGLRQRAPVAWLVQMLADKDAAVRTIALKALGGLSKGAPVERLVQMLADKKAGVRGAAVEVLAGLEEGAPVESLIQMLADKDAGVREAAARALGGLRKEAPVEKLIQLLRDSDPGVRRAAVQVLGEQGGSAPVERLVQMLADENSDVRRTTVWTLGKQTERVPVEQLERMLKDEDPYVRRAAVQVLGDLGEKAPVERLIQMLEDKHTGVCRVAAEALGKQGERVPLARLGHMLKDEGFSVRWAVLEVLEGLGKETAVERLAQMLEHENSDVRRAAVVALEALEERMPMGKPGQLLTDTTVGVHEATVKALIELGEGASVERLIQMLEDEDLDVQQAAETTAAGTQGLQEEDAPSWLQEQQRERVPVAQLEWRFVSENSNVRRAAVEVLAASGEHAPVEQLAHMLADGNPDVRRAAVQALEKRGVRVPLVQLERVLADENPDVRRAAVRVLGALGREVPVGRLEQLLVDTAPYVREMAVRVLGGLEESMPMERLARMLADKDPYVRRAAVRALGALGEEMPVERLEQLLADENSAVRRATVEVLGTLGERVPVERLEQLLTDEKPSVRQAVVQVLGGLGEGVPVERLMQVLADENPDVRQMVVQALGALGEDMLKERLNWVFEHKDSDVRRAAVEALGALGERAPVEGLKQHLEDQDPYVRRAAVEALGALGKRVPVERLEQMLADQDPSVRQATVWVLGASGERVPVERLEQMLADQDPSVRRAAVEALGVLGERVSIERLTRLLTDHDAGVRAATVWALGKRGEEVPLERLEQMLDDSDAGVRGVTVEVLGVLGEQAPPGKLERMLKDEDSGVREAAVQALGKQGKRVPIGQLEQLLADEDLYVCQVAMRVLGGLGESAPVERLEQMLEDDNAGMRRAAVEALGGLGERAPVDRLVRMLEDGDSDVRRATIQTLGKVGKDRKPEIFVAMVGDVNGAVRQAAIQAIGESVPDELSIVLAEAVAVLQHQPAGLIFGSLARSLLAGWIGHLERPSADLLEILTEMLDWPHWQVRVQAIEALGDIRRNIPDRAIQRLLDLRRASSPLMHTVRSKADEALGDILSLETGREDEW
jgi:HEAT repeat protein